MKIKDYEYICDRCDGLGLVKRKYEEFEVVTKSTTCPKCLGDGKLDFIENITGKKTKSFIIKNDGVTYRNGSLVNPPDPEKGDAYYNQEDDHMYVYDGNSWIEICDSVSIGGETI
jgi:hypothetical protein